MGLVTVNIPKPCVPTSDVLVPSQRLVGFARVTLNPGQSQTVHLSCPFRHLP
ncbi:MAG: hypothetical protein E6I53_01820 [Chloroflexi bacterium]|nr:MAG: hypothetical protein E6I53_01820 [Chloroflexota bacterium]